MLLSETSPSRKYGNERPLKPSGQADSVLLKGIKVSGGQESDSEIKIVEYILNRGSDTSFTEYFWKNCEPHPHEEIRYPLYAKVTQLFSQRVPLVGIARETGVKLTSIRRWTRFEQKPKLAHFLGLYLELGNPKPGWVWLSVNNTSGHAMPLGPMIQVPKAISNWNDVARVLAQLTPLRGSESDLSREYMFGFFIGMVIEDAAKSRSKNWHRHIGLVLSKKYATNERIGRLTCMCAQSMGLRMHRVSDQDRPTRKPHGFYEWVSQASPLLDWIFNVCLGLKDGERTTYDSVVMNWAFDSPEEFRRGLVQGIAESDGSVSVASQTVEFWIGPSWGFLKGLLQTFGVRSFRSREALSVSKNQVTKLGSIPPFSPLLKTPRYLRFEKLANARHIGRGKRLPAEIRNFIGQNCHGVSIPRISEMVVDRFGVVLSFEAVQRWARKPSNRVALTMGG